MARIRSLCTIQVFFLVLLTLQNATVVMLMSYTQQRQGPGSERYDITHIVMMQEITKGLVSLAWCALDVCLALRRPAPAKNTTADERGDAAGERQQRAGLLAEEATEVVDINEHPRGKCGPRTAASLFAFVPTRETWRRFGRHYVAELCHPSALWMFPPAAIFCLQNCILYVALDNLEPTVFQVTYQLRLFFTALLMRLFLGRTFSLRQWFALALLVVSVVAAQLGMQSTPNSNAKRNSTFVGNYVIGFAATLCASTMSSVASVLLEVFFKSQAKHMNSYISTKNVYLSFYSILCLAVVQTVNNGGFFLATPLGGASLGQTVRNYFRGFDGLVWTLVFIHALGGLLVAVVIRYSDNIMKAFASNLAIILSGFCSAYLYSFMPSVLLWFSNICSFVAIVMYNC